MHAKVFVTMNIAVIGSGDTAVDYATGFACAGHEVYLASKDGNKGCLKDVFELFDNIYPASIEDAADVADMIVIATEPKDVRETAYWLGDVRRKVIIDATANVPASGDELANTMGGISAITGSPHIVKVFNTRGYEQILRPIFGDRKVDLIIAGDSRKAREVTKIMAAEIGIKNCYDFGGNETIPLFDELTKSCGKLAANGVRIGKRVVR
jgi:8-hydroxy-5-deazaflavin:NADPH oxidoreductase